MLHFRSCANEAASNSRREEVVVRSSSNFRADGTLGEFVVNADEEMGSPLLGRSAGGCIR